jgi:hypothetical protein
MFKPPQFAPPKQAAPLLNIHAFLEAQRHERSRAFIVHRSPGNSETTFARTLVEATVKTTQPT